MKKTQTNIQRRLYVAPETNYLDMEMSIICASEGVLENFDSSDYDFNA